MDAIGLMYPASIVLGAAELVASYSAVSSSGSGGKISIPIDVDWDIGYIANLSKDGTDLWPGVNRGTLCFPTTASLKLHVNTQITLTFDITPTLIAQNPSYSGLTLAVCLFKLNK